MIIIRGVSTSQYCQRVNVDLYNNETPIMKGRLTEWYSPNTVYRTHTENHLYSLLLFTFV